MLDTRASAHTISNQAEILSGLYARKAPRRGWREAPGEGPF
jgi:hypothetical protein